MCEARIAIALLMFAATSGTLTAAEEAKEMPAGPKEEAPAAKEPAPAAGESAGAPGEAKAPDLAPKEAFRDLSKRLLERTLADDRWGALARKFDEAAKEILLEDEQAIYAKAALAPAATPKAGLEARFQAVLEGIPLADSSYTSLRGALADLILLNLPEADRIALGLQSATTPLPKIPEAKAGPKPAAGGEPAEAAPKEPAPPGNREASPPPKMPTGSDPGWNPLQPPPLQPPQNVSDGGGSGGAPPAPTREKDKNKEKKPREKKPKTKK